MTNISVALTEEQVLAREKDITRRLGWLKLKAGTVLQPIRQGQGLKKGETVTKVGGPIRVVSVRRESLRRLLDDQAYGLAEVVREGFPGLTPRQFVTFFMTSHRGCTVDTAVTRIEFKYLNAEQIAALCSDRLSCKACPKFRCTKCGKQRPWCVGAADNRPEWCDLCWARHGGAAA